MDVIIESRKIGVVDGFDIEAHLEPDPDTRPEDKETYIGDEEILGAWSRDEWHFVGTVVTASKAGVELGSAAIWGQEYGQWPCESGWLSPLDGDADSFGNGYGPDLIAEAIEEARETIQKINGEVL
jgi:hypothetical protein